MPLGKFAPGSAQVPSTIGRLTPCHHPEPHGQETAHPLQGRFAKPGGPCGQPSCLGRHLSPEGLRGSPGGSTSSSRKDTAMLARIRKAQEENEGGFTLIELLVVMIIIGILAAIAIPVFLNQRKSARDAAIKSDVRNIATSLESYYTNNQVYAVPQWPGRQLRLGRIPPRSAPGTPSRSASMARGPQSRPPHSAFRGRTPETQAMTGSTKATTVACSQLPPSCARQPATRTPP